MPDVEELWKKYEGQGVLVYGVHRGEDPGLLAAFVEQTGVTYPIRQDQGTLGLLSFPPGVGYPFPKDVVIGKDLTIRSIKASFNVEEMDALVSQLIAE